ncbi:pentapeptide repeat-containing protein [Daejeonella sp.]|uniref:pentapeptide repeat-containing protein n=1 Tax=Daejeonella sp. TaxID=2805397 RepID=UPI00272F3E92|nr:pentapeptide repeat-containing protein [Daejeonella sp.]MDP2414547.1 pentapeptide repeat-containing protein [Daejeonella sp.]
MNYIVDKTFERVKFNEIPFEQGEYENCIFRQCDFTNINLSEIKFTEVEFIGCNLSMVKLERTAFRDVIFKESKMLGLHFENCNEFGLAFSFEDCQLSHSSFYRTKIKKTNFKNSNLKDADFTECDLTGSVFQNCDLAGVTFENTILEKADFRTSLNYSIDPENNRIRKAKFSILEISGLLDKYDIEIDSSI